MQQRNLTARSKKSETNNTPILNRNGTRQISRRKSSTIKPIIFVCCLGLSIFYAINKNSSSAIMTDLVPVVKETETENLVPVVKETVSENVKPEKKEPLEGWIYEPKNPDFFWKKMGDRPFQREFYSRLGKFDRIIDVGARGYNRYCKELINSTKTEYFQIEPFPPSQSEMNNDGLFECYMQETQDKYPESKGGFDLVIDFGVFGWKPVLVGFSKSDIRKYVESVRFLLKDKGCWALKIDKGWVDDQQKFFDDYLLPYFDLGKFDNAYESGHSVKRGNFLFYFFYKK